MYIEIGLFPLSSSHFVYAQFVFMKLGRRVHKLTYPYKHKQCTRLPIRLCKYFQFYYSHVNKLSTAKDFSSLFKRYALESWSNLGLYVVCSLKSIFSSSMNVWRKCYVKSNLCCAPCKNSQLERMPIEDIKECLKSSDK